MSVRLPVFLSLFAAASASFAADPASIRPLAADGHVLNLGFEAGTLADWTAEGEAFKGQPVKGPIDPKRPLGEGKFSNHQGNFWIGGFEILRDEPKGTLTSVPFKAAQPWASFLVGAGSLPGTRVEIVTKDDGKVIHAARGAARENMARSVVDLRKFSGREIFIRLVDEETVGWGHVNFDDFVFHAEEPKFAQPANVVDLSLKPDEVKFAGLAPAEAVKAADLPKGFEMTMFAAEPDVANPISFCIDDRGRLWVVEGITYPHRAKEGEGKDRILVFEDTDGDGRSDKRTVFMEGLNLVSGIEFGFGGLWVGAAPNFMFIPVADGDTPKPAGEPKILLDGWGFQDTHETLNSFRWGPDGWLYGCHGVFTHSNVGKPGAPDSGRTKINAGFWRYQPQRHEFEVFAHGTSNSWGIDFDRNGQLIAEACVIPHLFHISQGARYNRQAGQHFNPNTYDDIKTIADHRHYLGANPHGGNSKSDSAGGGHAHAGLCIPQGPGFGDWTGRVLMGNIHGQRINADILDPKGSGYIGKHGPDFVNFNDRASQVVDIRQGPGGTIYMIDWYDINQCHRTQREAHEYSKGRIYRVAASGTKVVAPGLAAKTDADLAKLSLSDDAWARTHARRLLQERKLKAGSALFSRDAELSASQSVWALWTDHTIGAADDARIAAALKSPHEYVRAWAIQSATEDRTVSAELRAEFARLAKQDPSPVVRRYLASAADRLPVDQRLPILEPLLAHAEDVGDPNLPLMNWYALEPVVGADATAAATLLGSVKIPIIQEYIARRMASASK
jgi:putative membrane-bound dehydrogenase-like protein